MLDTIEKSISNFSFVAPSSEEFIFVSSKNFGERDTTGKSISRGTDGANFSFVYSTIHSSYECSECFVEPVTI